MKHVVVIDDSETTLKVVEQVLTAAGYEVTTALEPSREKVVGKGEPDLILVDVNMPQAFGDDVISLLKLGWALESKILFYSEVSEEELSERARECGADGFILKAWGPERLVEEVKKVLGDD